jgi:hypothetical protein
LKKVAMFGMALMMVWLGTCDIALATLRCQGKIISRGDSRSRVRSLCREPTSIKSKAQQMAEHMYDLRLGRSITYNIHSTDEEWTYEIGPAHLVYVLTFRSGKLATIKTRQ